MKKQKKSVVVTNVNDLEIRIRVRHKKLNNDPLASVLVSSSTLDSSIR
jgi:hypothetical protein